jgi:hypothetical protein
MADAKNLDLKNVESLVEQAVNSVLDSLMPGLRKQLVRQVMRALEPELAASSSAAPVQSAAAAGATDETDKLNRALAVIQAGGTQVEILDAMIEGASNFAARAALFVVRGANAVGWRARGFSDNEAVRSTPLELSEGLTAKSLQARGMVAGPASEFTFDFESKFGASGHEGLMLPLLVRDKAVALLYADGGTGEHRLDSAALQSLVRTTGLWLEVFSTRKSLGTAMSAASSQPHAMAAAAAAASAPAVVAPEPELAPAPVKTAAPASISAPMPSPVVIPAGEDGEVHKKARRFAKLLVDEIKLYNQNKVTEGRQHRDLYDRLKDDIEKSRASYEKRYGSTVAKEGDYFNQELVRILADNDTALLGNNFRR